MALSDDLQRAQDCLRDIVALSTLPAIWSGAEPLRIAESLAAALFTILRPQLVYVSIIDAPGRPPIAVAQTDRYETSPPLAERLGSTLLEWARTRDPDELLLLPNPLGTGILRLSMRPLGLHAELGVIAAGFEDERSSTEFQRLVLNVGATQAATAIQNARLLCSLRESEERVRATNTELDERLAALEQAGTELRDSQRAALNLMEDAVRSRELVETLNRELVSEIAERQQKAEALRQRTAQFETLLNRAPLGVYLVDADFRIRDVNPTALPVFGDIPDLIGRDFEEVLQILWMKESADELVRIFRHTLKTGESYHAPERIQRRRDGSGTAYYEWRIDRIPLPDGRYGVVCYFRDVSAQVRARATIAESEERLRALVTASSDVIYHMSPDWSEMRHLDGREFIADTLEPSGTWLEKYIHPDDQPRMLAAIREAIRTRSVFELEHRVFRVDGALGWTFSRAIPILDERGEIVEWFGMASDVTRRKEAEAALRDSEQRLRFVMDSMPQKIFTATPAGNVDYFNPIWTEFTGLSFAQIRDWGWTQFIHPDDAAENIRVWQHSIDTGEPFQFEHRFQRADGVYRWHLSRAVPMRDAEGRVVLWIGANTDIDDVKRAEEALKEADRRKDEFVAMLAHELRNPLAPILNAVQIQGSLGPADPRLPGQRDVIKRQIDQMRHLLDDLLDVSRITRSKIQLRPERLELAAVISEAVEASRPLLEGKQHQLSVTLPPERVWLEADRTRLAQVLTNLLSNAAKYTDPGGRIELRAELSTPHSVRICVRDNGIGMTPEVLAHVFDLFAQADRSLDRSQGGLGIGLTIVRRLVEMHGGEVSAYSAGPGMGSEFVVRLPVQAVDRELREGRREEVPCPPAPTTARRILVVDDNADTAETLAELLALDGHEVFRAQDGTAALAAAREHQPEVILLDIGLPGKDGYEVARELRRMPDLQRAVLVAITGYGQEQDRQRSRKAGFEHHLVKPVDYGQLTALLAQCAGGEREAPETGRG